MSLTIFKYFHEGKHAMIDAKEIKNDMPVITAQAEQFAEVDHLVSSDLIKLKKDVSGTHHFIPVSWVISTEGGRVKVNRTLSQVKEDWGTEQEACPVTDAARQQ